MVMTPETILKKAIEKAVKNGYKLNLFYKEYPNRQIAFMSEGLYKTGLYYQLIFSHNFAKAFWGEGTHANFQNPKEPLKSDNECRFCGCRCTWYGVNEKEETYAFIPKCWQYHLQQMVITDPIKYLEKFL